MRRLALIGAGGHGSVIADIASECGYEEIVFLDNQYPAIKEVSGYPVCGPPDEMVEKLNEGWLGVVTIGDNQARQRMWHRLGMEMSPVLRHPASTCSKKAALGSGTVVCAGVVINVEASIGKGVILNTGCTVDHQCVVGDFVHISPGASVAGEVTVGDRSWIGIGAVIREGIRIGRDVIVGAGAVVVCDVPDSCTVVGVPAKIRVEE